ncbi:MAG: DNA polymerase III subunit delta [Anaerolineales bacterium]|nr:DNA polymerase III subunit delta [Anaerolineales bacterium]
MSEEKSPVFFLFGNDELAITKRIGEFTRDFPDQTSADMNTARLDARSMSEDELNNAVNAMPFLAPKRLVVLGNPSARYNHPASRKKFCKFLEAVPDTARLVIHEQVELKNYRDKSRQEKEDEKHWLVKWGKQTGIGLERYSLPSAREMPGWIVTEARKQGGQIEPEAAGQLAEMVGVDTRQAAQEIAKLLMYVNFEHPVGVKEVETVCIVTAQQSVFDFVDALAAGKGGQAQRLLHQLLADEDGFSLWGMVIRQFRLLLLAREVIESGGSPRDAAGALGVHPFVAEKSYQQARNFSLPALENIYRRLLEIDVGVKTGQVTMDLALDVLVVELSSAN